MTSAQHAAWIRSGSHWQLAAPLAALRDALRAHGYTVYDLGNTDHLDHQPPEDHTPYSETGWPGRTPYGWVTAIDIMPKAGLPSLLELGLQIERDWPAWLKYMNRPTNAANTRAVHVSRQPNPASKSSSDTGHIHISCRSDATATASTYDPVARLRGQVSGGDEVSAHTDQVIDAWRQGNRVAEDGSNVEPVEWRLRDEQWQGNVNARLDGIDAKLAALSAPVVTPTPEQWAALTAAIVEKLGSAAAAALSPSKLKAGTLEAFREIGANIPPAS